MPLLRRAFEEEVDEVDLASFLLGCGSEFEQGTDGDGLVEHPGGLLCHAVPEGVGVALLVGIGEEDDAVSPEREQLAVRQLVQPACRQPQVLGEVLGEDDGGLLGLYDGTGLRLAPGLPLLTQQMGAEETVCGVGHPGCHVGELTQELPLQQVAGPLRMPVVVAVAVRTVVHDLAVVDLSQPVYLPEDDAAVAASSQPVSADGLLHLCLGQVAVGDAGPTEIAVGREPLLPHRLPAACDVVTQGMVQGLERIGKTFADFHWIECNSINLWS